MSEKELNIFSGVYHRVGSKPHTIYKQKLNKLLASGKTLEELKNENRSVKNKECDTMNKKYLEDPTMYICNPENGKWYKKTGPIGKKLLRKKVDSQILDSDNINFDASTPIKTIREYIKNHNLNIKSKDKMTLITSIRKFYENRKNKEENDNNLYKEYGMDLKDLKTKWTCVNVPGDNHCGFHTLSLFLRLNELINDREKDNILFLRKLLIQQYEKEKLLNNGKILKEDIEKRIENLTDDPTEWLTDDDMIIFSKYYNLCFAILRKDPTTDSLGWHIISYKYPYGYENIMERSLKSCKKNKKIIYLYNPDWSPTSPGLHYDLLFPSDPFNNVEPLFEDYTIKSCSEHESIFHKIYCFEKITQTEDDDESSLFSLDYQKEDLSEEQESGSSINTQEETEEINISKKVHLDVIVSENKKLMTKNFVHQKQLKINDMTDIVKELIHKKHFPKWLL